VTITRRSFDCVVIGAGAAGMAAAAEVANAGYTVAMIDREEYCGGILQQCIHNGFGLHHFGEELTGPEYAEICADSVRSLPVEIFPQTTITRMKRLVDTIHCTACSSRFGIVEISAATVVLAMGSRERNRGNIGIPGSRPSGVFTAGLAQRLLNIEGYIPGKKAVIIGSGDIGLIMARRLTWVGTKVEAVIEILPHPSGLTRNIVQCLEDFSIPLYLSHAVTNIVGKDRVEGVMVAPLENGVPVPERTRTIECDTVLLSVGLIPENELSVKAGVKIHPNTGGPVVDHRLMTTVPGIFACGNVLHVHDLVDFVTEESKRCGEYVAAYLKTGDNDAVPTVSVEAGANIKYVTPNQCAITRSQPFFMRALLIREAAELTVSQGDTVVFTKKCKHVKPAEMLSLTLPESITAALIPSQPLTFSLR